MLDEAGVPKEQRAVYRGMVGTCCAAELNFEPGSRGEKKQVDERILDPNSIRLGLDTTLARKLAGVVLPDSANWPGYSRPIRGPSGKRAERKFVCNQTAGTIVACARWGQSLGALASNSARYSPHLGTTASFPGLQICGICVICGCRGARPSSASG